MTVMKIDPATGCMTEDLARLHPADDTVTELGHRLLGTARPTPLTRIAEALGIAPAQLASCSTLLRPLTTPGVALEILRHVSWSHPALQQVDHTLPRLVTA